MTKRIHKSDSGSWYYTTIVIRIDVAGDDRTIIHRNTVLVRATDNEDAYLKALALGEKYEIDGINPQGQIVKTRFLGLSSLGLIYDEFEHGAELFWEEDIGVSEDEIASVVRPREELELFRERRPSYAPDYSSFEGDDELKKKLHGGSGDPPN